ncbi:MAG TPA: hypothetical protein VMM59_12245 [Thermohalobaculum sp.]|nr:hypothetical protein [Thermohalobaculum sp.]
MILTETAPAAVTPVSLSELSAHLRLAHGFPDDGAEDALLELYLRNGAAAVEARTGRALIRRGFLLRLAAWDRHGHAALPVGPVEAIATLRFVRGTEAVDVAAGSWALEPGTGRQRVTGAQGGALSPIPEGYVAELAFDAGFGADPADVPGELRQAVLLLAADFYERRHDDGGAGIPMTVRALLEPWQPVRI